MIEVRSVVPQESAIKILPVRLEDVKTDHESLDVAGDIALQTGRKPSEGH